MMPASYPGAFLDAVTLRVATAWACVGKECLKRLAENASISGAAQTNGSKRSCTWIFCFGDVSFSGNMNDNKESLKEQLLKVCIILII